MKSSFYTLILLIGSISCCIGSNLQIKNVLWESSSSVQIIVSWEHSWNLEDKSTPNNHDAVYLFAKEKQDNTNFSNLSLLNATSSQSSVCSEIRSLGVLLKTCENSLDNSQSCTLTIQLAKPLSSGNHAVRWYAIEMAQVPKADSLFLGDGKSNKTFGDKQGKPVLLKNQSAIFSGKDSLGIISKPEEFYLMKYEISQRQYVDFLNALNPLQQDKFIEVKNAKVGDAAFPSFISNRNGIKLKTLANVELSAVFYTNEPYVACNGLSASDVLGYLCWAGLRPLTEIEFEYAARGPKYPKAKEGAWGTIYCQDVNSLNDSTLSSEEYIKPLENDSTGSANFGLPVGNYYLQGPARSGALFTSSSNRISAGSGYFGNADLSGNVWELCIDVTKIPNRIDLGTGNVEDLLNNKLNWPTTETGYIYRGGGWNSIVLNSLAYPFRDIAISDRFYAGGNSTIRRNTTGGRGAL